MFCIVSRGRYGSGYILLTFKCKTSGEWVLATYDAFLARRRTQAAGDNVHFLSIETGCTIVVVRETATREIQELLICSPAITLDDFDNHYFCLNNSKFQKRSELLTRSLDIVIPSKNRYQRVSWFQILIDILRYL